MPAPTADMISLIRRARYRTRLPDEKTRDYLHSKYKTMSLAELSEEQHAEFLDHLQSLPRGSLANWETGKFLKVTPVGQEEPEELRGMALLEAKLSEIESQKECFNQRAVLTPFYINSFATSIERALNWPDKLYELKLLGRDSLYLFWQDLEKRKGKDYCDKVLKDLKEKFGHMVDFLELAKNNQ